MLYSLPSINQSNKNFSCCLLSLFSWIPDIFFFFFTKIHEMFEQKSLRNYGWFFCEMLTGYLFQLTFFFLSKFIYSSSRTLGSRTLWLCSTQTLFLSYFASGRALPKTQLLRSWWSTQGPRETSAQLKCSVALSW